MKLLFFFLFAACMQVSATGLAQRITYSGQKVPIKQVLREIGRLAGMDVMFTNDIINESPLISINLKNATLADALTYCLKDKPFTFEIMEEVIVIKSIADAVGGVPHLEIDAPPFRGIVRDQAGKPLAGATVRVKGKKLSAITNEAGWFQIEAEKGAVLLVTHIGYEEKQFTVNKFVGVEGMSIKLMVFNTSLDTTEVTFNTGYQKMKPNEITGSIVKVNKELFNRRVSTDIISRLEGVTNGLLFDRRPDVNGQSKLSLQIRGLFTLTEEIAQPLIVLDNFPYLGNLNDINPNDIEDVTILRDAAAASIWGAKAGNGVIVITTKKAAFNSPLKLSFNANVSRTGRPDLFSSPVIQAADMIDIEKFYFDQGIYDEAISSPVYAPITPAVDIFAKVRDGIISEEEGNAQIAALKTRDIRGDYSKYFYRPQLNQQYSIALSGGNRNISNSFSVGFDRNLEGLVGNDFSRVSIRNSTTMKPIENLVVDFSAGYTYAKSHANSPGAYGDTYYNSFNTALPLYSQLKNPDGTSGVIDKYYKSAYLDTAGGGQLLDWKLRPLDELNNNDNVSIANAFIAALGIRYGITSSLSAEIKYQYQRSTEETNRNSNINSFIARDAINSFTNLNAPTTEQRYPVPLGGILDRSGNSSERHGVRGQINYNQVFGTDHVFNAFAGVELNQEKRKTSQDRIYGYSENLNNARVDYINYYPQYVTGGFAQVPSMTSFGDFTNRTVSAFANIGYVFKNRYKLSGSARRDASNLFGVNTNDKWKPFWSVGAGWDISREKFYHFGALPTLGLKASYGYSGNVNNSIPAITTLAYFPSSFNSLSNLPFATINQPGNPDLRWEKLSTLNIGLDFGLRNGKLSGSLEWYSKKSTDVISFKAIDFTSGIAVIPTNSADMTGSGINLQLNGHIISGKDLKWYSSFNFTSSIYKVSKILNDVSDIVIPSTGLMIMPVVGSSPYSIISFKWAGLNPDNGNPRGIINGKISENYDSIVVFSPASDQVINGSALPLYFGNFLHTISWKQLSLSFNIIYSFDYFINLNSISYDGLSIGYSHSDYYKRWQKPGDETRTSVPSFVYPNVSRRDYFYQNSEINVIEGDNIRFNDININYTLDRRFIRGLPFQQLSFYGYLGGLNVVLWKANNRGVDPLYPSGIKAPKSISFGVRANF